MGDRLSHVMTKRLKVNITQGLESRHLVQYGCYVVVLSCLPRIIYAYNNNDVCLFVSTFLWEFFQSLLDCCFYGCVVFH